MRRILNFFCFSTLVFFMSFVCSVKAEVLNCSYTVGNLEEQQELKIIYDTEKEFSLTTNPLVKIGEYSSDNFESNFYVLWAKRKRTSSNVDLKIDQNLFYNASGSYACPEKFYVCDYNKIGVALTGVVNRNLTNIIATIVNCIAGEHIADNIGVIYDEVESLAIISEKDYETSEYKDTDGKTKFAIFNIGSSGSINKQFETFEWYDPFVAFAQIWHSVAGVADNETLQFVKSDCTYIENYSGQYMGFNINCAVNANYTNKLIIQISEYKDCEDLSCKREKSKEIDKTENKIKNQCKTILQNYQYSGGSKACIDDCLSIKDKINALKEGTDLYIDYTKVNDECNSSERLLAWISNILRWIKYILPVVVIILGILDFLKALTSDKDDEMKKAQGNFVKRLIAAALVFIVPLIIEFILEKMGFGYDSCGLF